MSQRTRDVREGLGGQQRSIYLIIQSTRMQSTAACSVGSTGEEGGGGVGVYWAKLAQRALKRSCSIARFLIAFAIWTQAPADPQPLHREKFSAAHRATYGGIFSARPTPRWGAHSTSRRGSTSERAGNHRSPQASNLAENKLLGQWGCGGDRLAQRSDGQRAKLQHRHGSERYLAGLVGPGARPPPLDRIRSMQPDDDAP